MHARPVLPAGKLPAELLAALLRDAGAGPGVADEVLLGPAVGEDAAVVRVTGGALVLATDPVTLTSADAGRLAVIVNANDVAVRGARPRWFLATVLLPLGTAPADADSLFAGLRAGLEAVGAVLVGGHTEVSAAVTQPVVVGHMVGLNEDGRFITTGGARVGDAVVQIGPAPVEGAAVLAAEAADALRGLPEEVVRAAAGAVDNPGISVVKAALTAAELGATSLHDVTEGGLAGALHEVATAASRGLEINAARVLWFDPGLQVCQALGLDPWATLSSGTLLATFGPDDFAAALARLGADGAHAARIGTVVDGTGVTLVGGGALPCPARDEVARFLSG